MKKIRYEIDPHNRLVINSSSRKTSLPKFRKVIDGRFKISEFNELSYHVKAPCPTEEKIPRQIKLKGAWSLTDEHMLRLTLDTLGRETFGDQVTLQGEILDVNKNSLLFAVTTSEKDNIRSTYVLNLEGIWKADEFNRLSFHVKKEGGKYDILSLKGAWEINKDHQIIYRYEKSRLIRKKKEYQTLTFQGYWDIKDAFRISYLLGAGTDSSFDFQASAGIFRDKYIKYEVGIRASGHPDSVRRAVTLFGIWNLKKDVGLVFEIEYGDDGTKRIVFGADAKLTDKDAVSFRLRNDPDNRDMGVSLELSRKILKGDGEAFIRLLKSNKESAVYAGAAWRW